MSIATEISRLTSLRNSIRTKLIALGILSNAQADLQDIYNGINGISAKDSTNLSVSGNTVTAPAGYYNSAASASVANGSISASATGSATISGLTFAYDSTNGRFEISGSGSISGTATASVGTAGYVSSGATGSTSGTASVSAHIAKIAGSTEITGASTRKPTIARTTTTAAGATNVGTGDATTTAPSSGYFVSVKSNANTGTLTATPTVSSAGYGNAEQHGIEAATKTVGASASDVTYVQVPGGSAATPATTITKNPTISVDTNGLITASVSGTESITPTVSEGYVEAGTAGTITVAGSATSQLTTKAAATITPGTTDQTISSGQYLTGAQTIKGDANLIAANIRKGVTIFGITGTFTGIVDSEGTEDPLNLTLIGTVGS